MVIKKLRKGGGMSNNHLSLRISNRNANLSRYTLTQILERANNKQLTIFIGI